MQIGKERRECKAFPDRNHIWLRVNVALVTVKRSPIISHNI